MEEKKKAFFPSKLTSLLKFLFTFLFTIAGLVIDYLKDVDYLSLTAFLKSFSRQ